MSKIAWILRHSKIDLVFIRLDKNRHYTWSWNLFSIRAYSEFSPSKICYESPKRSAVQNTYSLCEEEIPFRFNCFPTENGDFPDERRRIQFVGYHLICSTRTCVKVKHENRDDVPRPQQTVIQALILCIAIEDLISLPIYHSLPPISFAWIEYMPLKSRLFVIIQWVHCEDVDVRVFFHFFCDEKIVRFAHQRLLFIHSLGPRDCQYILHCDPHCRRRRYDCNNDRMLQAIARQRNKNQATGELEIDSQSQSVTRSKSISRGFDKTNDSLSVSVCVADNRRLVE